jgi:TonB-dependent starch-binding outer membrane protein SusC
MSVDRVTLVFLAVLLVPQPARAQTPPPGPGRPSEETGALLGQPARLRIDDVPLATGLLRLHHSSGVPLAFSPSLIPVSPRVSCRCEQLSVREALDRMLSGTSLTYVELAGQIVIEQSLRPTPGRAPESPTQAPPLPSRERIGPDPGTVPEPGGYISLVGTVTQASTRRALPGVQISLHGTGIGTLSNATGGFRLMNAPAGELLLRAQRIGFEPIEQRVVLSPGEQLSVNLTMRETALALDEVVVTGTAGAARRREVGNSIVQIRMADFVEPAVSVDAVLQARAPGMTVMENAGRVGAGASIRLRGNVSASMSNQPLIYVDGVRIRSEGLPKNAPPIGYPGRGPNTTYSALNDINPADIERIEIIKGAAATTLYGTEAATGVIQIFTKQGQPGQTQWTLQVEQGMNVLRPFGPTTGIHGERLARPPEGEDHSYMFMEPFLRTGLRNRYHLGVSGGSTAARYFLSGAWSRQDGVLPNDHEEKISVRGNMYLAPLPGLQLNWNSAYSSNALEQTAAGPDGQGITINASRRERNYLGTRDPSVLSQLLEFENQTAIDHFVTGVTATHMPSRYFSSRVTLGYDLIQQRASSLRPFGWILAPQGVAHETRWRHAALTAEYVGMLSWKLGDHLSSSLAVGGQSVTMEESSTTAYGERFPGPGRPTVSSAAMTLGFQDLTRVINAGVFLQETLAYRDRYFLTTGLRIDGNSAFGRNLGMQSYPKLSLSYVISEEPFWRQSLGQLKLRAAYGHAGRAPGAFDAVRTWNPVGWGGQPAFRPLNLGNPDLGPERTAELEVGFDGSFLHERLSVEFTHYRQKTTDALFSVRQPASGGFLGDQLANVGTLENRGVELAVRAGLHRGREWGVEVGSSLATNHSRVLDLGGAAPFTIGNYGWILEGQPVPAIRGDCVRNPQEKAPPAIDQDCVHGPNLPTLTLGFSSELRFPRGIAFSARGEYQEGGWGFSTSDGEAFTRGIRWPACLNAYAKLDAGRADELSALEQARCVPTNAKRDFAIYPLDFFKLREATLRAPLPFSLPGVAESEIALSARNALGWKRERSSHFDPEDSGGFGRGDTGMEQRTRSVGGSIPVPAIYSLALRMRF